MKSRRWARRTLVRDSLLFLSRHLKTTILRRPRWKRQLCLQPQHSHLSKASSHWSNTSNHCQDGHREQCYCFIPVSAPLAPHVKAPPIANLQRSCSLWTLSRAPRASLGLDLTRAIHRRRWGASGRKTWFDRNVFLSFGLTFKLLYRSPLSLLPSLFSTIRYCACVSTPLHSIQCY